MSPPFPTRLGKKTKLKDIGGHEKSYEVIAEDVFAAQSNPEKAFAVHKLKWNDGREEFRIGYFTTAHRPRTKGKWAWGQFAPMMTEAEMTEIFQRAEKLMQRCS